MSKYIKLLLAGMLFFCGAAAAGCADRDGPMEKAGENIDEAVEDAGDQIEDATD